MHLAGRQMPPNSANSSFRELISLVAHLLSLNELQMITEKINKGDFRHTQPFRPVQPEDTGTPPPRCSGFLCVCLQCLSAIVVPTGAHLGGGVMGKAGESGGRGRGELSSAISVEAEFWHYSSCEAGPALWAKPGHWTEAFIALKELKDELGRKGWNGPRERAVMVLGAE